jgi:hypothetical protein
MGGAQSSFVALAVAVVAGLGIVGAWEPNPVGRMPVVRVWGREVRGAVLHDESPTLLAMRGMPGERQLAVVDPDEGEEGERRWSGGEIQGQETRSG